MKSKRFKNEKKMLDHQDDADKALDKWLEDYHVHGLAVGRNADGKVVRITFNKRAEIKLKQSTEVEVVETPDPEAKPITKKKGCGSCEKNKLKRLISGGAKLLKAELGVDAADDDTIIDRKKLCLNCPSYDFGVCDDCGCFCAAKVKLKSEVCPQGKW